MQHSLTEKFGPWVNAAIDKHGQGENIAWEPSLTPDQSRNPTYTITLWLPGAVLGSIALGSFQVNDPLNATEDKVDEIISEMLRQLREQRSRQIEQQGNGHGHHPVGGNPHQSASGLILPT